MCSVSMTRKARMQSTLQHQRRMVAFCRCVGVCLRQGFGKQTAKPHCRWIQRSKRTHALLALSPNTTPVRSACVPKGFDTTLPDTLSIPMDTVSTAAESPARQFSSMPIAAPAVTCVDLGSRIAASGVQINQTGKTTAACLGQARLQARAPNTPRPSPATIEVSFEENDQDRRNVRSATANS